MKLDLNKTLDGAGEADVVTADVDLSGTRVNGQLPFHTPVKVTARAKNRVGVVTLDCTYDFTLKVTCDRCLVPFELPVSHTANHTVVRALNGEDDETFLVTQDGFVELDELATNDILPELPTRFLCSEDCRGLCPVCGANRNQTDCGCSTAAPDPRLAALRDLLKN